MGIYITILIKYNIYYNYYKHIFILKAINIYGN